ncbi:helix-turn-helix domain-containing protein [Vallitalea sediminicola]
MIYANQKTTLEIGYSELSVNELPEITIGNRIRKSRLKKGLSQATLAKEANIGRKYLIGFENDRYFPSLYNIRNIAEVLQVNEDYLCDSYLRFIKNNPSEKILSIRKGLNLTRRELGELLNVHSGTIKKWEISISIINRFNYSKLVSLLEIEPTR